jgi:hypothetical protein
LGAPPKPARGPRALPIQGSTQDAFAIFNILTMLGVNTSGHERKDKLSSICDGQYPINFEGYLTVRHREHVTINWALSVAASAGSDFRAGLVLGVDNCRDEHSILDSASCERNYWLSGHSIFIFPRDSDRF